MQNLRVVSLALLAVLFVTLLGTDPAASQQKTVAILYFENNSLVDREKLEPLRKGLADMLITELSKIEQFKVVERSQLQAVLEEIQLSMTGAVDQSTAQRVGKLLGAQTLLLGGFVNMFGDQMRIDVRIVEVETGRTLKAEEATGNLGELFRMIKKLAEKVAKDLDVSLTKADRERLKVTTNESFEATVYYSRGLDLMDAGQYSQARRMFEEALKISPGFTEASDRVREIAARK